MANRKILNIPTNVNSFVVLLAGGFLVWKYRFQIQEQLESMGIRTPWLNDNFEGGVRSAGAKLKGKLKRDWNQDNTIGARLNRIRRSGTSGRNVVNPS